MKKSAKIIVCSVLGVIAAALIAATVMLALALSDLKIKYETQSAADSATISALGSDKASLEGKLADAVKQNEELEASLADMEGYFAEHYKGLVTENEQKIQALENIRAEVAGMVAKQESKPALDLTDLHNMMSQLEDYAKKSSPLVRVMRTEEEIEKLKEESDDADAVISDHSWVKADKYIEEGKKALGDAYSDKLTLDEIIASTGASAPQIAFYYEDILTGSRYAYNGDTVFDSASVMKAPYITAVLEALTDYESGGLSLDEKEFEEYTDEVLAEMFDLDSKIVLDHETMDKPGSGVLVKADDGTEYTYRELIELSLEKSDNTAFALVRARFTNKWYFDYARDVGARSPLLSYMNMSVNEAGALFKSVYYFTLENPEYGTFVRECMTESAHTVLSKTALGKKDVAHKYGWDVDAYHDAAIVYGERPYIAIVFTDIDSGGTDADRYIREIFKKIDEIHNTLA
ncbi:MAG: serine hydrolase [Clostridia bacterium]|nr:serine hydrolase [Clostridia bacterium]